MDGGMNPVDAQQRMAFRAKTSLELNQKLNVTEA